MLSGNTYTKFQKFKNFPVNPAKLDIGHIQQRFHTAKISNIFCTD